MRRSYQSACPVCLVALVAMSGHCRMQCPACGADLVAAVKTSLDLMLPEELLMWQIPQLLQLPLKCIPNAYHHPQSDIDLVVHGDDFTADCLGSKLEVASKDIRGKV